MEREIYSYSLIRYEHCSIKREFINVGYVSLSKSGVIDYGFLSWEDINKKALGLWGEKSFGLIRSVVENVEEEINGRIHQDLTAEQKIKWMNNLVVPMEGLIHYSNISTGFIKPTLKVV